ncbi:MAG TPA: hypothetical protein VGM07_21345 [Stellaceae bacterium]
MKFMLLAGGLAFAVGSGWAAAPAHAAGCLKGAAVGAVAGHVAGHHGKLGAAGGCVVGHHEATKAAREKTEKQAPSDTGSANSTPTH